MPSRVQTSRSASPRLDGSPRSGHALRGTTPLQTVNVMQLSFQARGGVGRTRDTRGATGSRLNRVEILFGSSPGRPPIAAPSPRSKTRRRYRRPFTDRWDRRYQRFHPYHQAP